MKPDLAMHDTSVVDVCICTDERAQPSCRDECTRHRDHQHVSPLVFTTDHGVHLESIEHLDMLTKSDPGMTSHLIRTAITHIAQACERAEERRADMITGT